MKKMETELSIGEICFLESENYSQMCRFNLTSKNITVSTIYYMNSMCCALCKILFTVYLI